MKTSTSKPKRNVWTDTSPYGTYEGEAGSPEQWAGAFNFVWDKSFAQNLVKDDSPWAILGIPVGSPAKVIKKAYWAKMQECHPDHGGSTEACQRIISAYVLLKG